MNDNTDFEVIILGGSYAGLSAAMALGRSLRKVLIIDSELPCNWQTPYSHNFITHDGEKPYEILEKAKAEVLEYDTVYFLNDTAVSGKKIENRFVISTQSGKELHGQKLIFATGITDIMPELKGFAECWGISVVHCPYCHGYEFRAKRTGILANGTRGFHLASLVNNLTDKLTLLTGDKPDFSDEQKLKLKQREVAIVQTPLVEIQHKKGLLNKVVFSDGSSKGFDVLYAALPFRQHSDIPASLGCELSEIGHIKVGQFQETTVHGVYACGDSSNMMRSVALAVSTGNVAGAVVNSKLVEENF